MKNNREPEQKILTIKKEQIVELLKQGKNIELSTIFLTHANLDVLDLSNCSLGIDELKNLSNVIAQNNTLSKIYLNDNQVSNQGAKILGEALAINKNLKFLSLERNIISLRGVKSLEKAIIHNNTLSYIDLEHNKPDIYDELLMDEVLDEIATYGLIREYVEDKRLNSFYKQCCCLGKMREPKWGALYSSEHEQSKENIIKKKEIEEDNDNVVIIGSNPQSKKLPILELSKEKYGIEKLSELSHKLDEVSFQKDPKSVLDLAHSTDDALQDIAYLMGPTSNSISDMTK